MNNESNITVQTREKWKEQAIKLNAYSNIHFRELYENSPLIKALELLGETSEFKALLKLHLFVAKKAGTNANRKLMFIDIKLDTVTPNQLLQSLGNSVKISHDTDIDKLIEYSTQSVPLSTFMTEYTGTKKSTERINIRDKQVLNLIADAEKTKDTTFIEMVIDKPYVVTFNDEQVEQLKAYLVESKS